MLGIRWGGTLHVPWQSNASNKSNTISLQQPLRSLTATLTILWDTVFCNSSLKATTGCQSNTKVTLTHDSSMALTLMGTREHHSVSSSILFFLQIRFADPLFLHTSKGALFGTCLMIAVTADVMWLQSQQRYNHPLMANMIKLAKIR